VLCCGFLCCVLDFVGGVVGLCCCVGDLVLCWDFVCGVAVVCERCPLRATMENRRSQMENKYLLLYASDSRH